MPQADILTNGALISALFPLLILIAYIKFDNYDDTAVQERLSDFTETAIDTDRICFTAESNTQELVYSIPVFVQEYYLVNCPAVTDDRGEFQTKSILSQFEAELLEFSEDSPLTEMTRILKEFAADTSFLEQATSNVNSDLFFRDKHNLHQLDQALPVPLPVEITADPIFVKGLLPEPDPYEGLSLNDLPDETRRISLPLSTNDPEFYRQIEIASKYNTSKLFLQRFSKRTILRGSALQMGSLVYKSTQVQDDCVDSYLDCNREDYKHIPRVYLDAEMQLALIRYFFRDTKFD